uniref:Uncharacterized protein n=1 Tax=Brassica oleracea TaxID=3712 RepID=A0A3P6DZG4_BRAOL|nr:unnamed protein product [Brassica oleracea]
MTTRRRRPGEEHVGGELGGNDDLKIIDCESLPQHTGLNLVDVLEAEHHSEGCGDGGASGKIAVGEAKDGANVAHDGDEAESKESDGVIAKEHVGSSGDGGIGDCTTKVSQGKYDNPSTGAEDVGVAELEERTEVCFC